MTKILWYISPVDGPYPWSEAGRYRLDHRRLVRTAETIDRRGFYGALLGTYSHDVWTLASTLVPFTRNMRFLLPIYPGIISPTLLAQQALTFEDFSDGRLLFNLVVGTDPILSSFGVNVPHDERYDLSIEFWESFKKIYQGEQISEPGKYYDLTGLKVGAPTSVDKYDRRALGMGPIQLPYTPLWGAGASPAGIDHAGKVVETFLAMLDRPDKLRVQVDAVRDAARRHGRDIRIGVHGSVIVRETEEEAWAHAQWLLDKTGGEILQKLALHALEHRGISGGLEALHHDDPQVQFRIDALREGRVPAVRDLEIAPHLWCGVTPWSPLDPLGQGWGTFIVGNPQQVADKIRELEHDLGIDALILSNWPLEEEANRFADRVLPLLESDYEAPELSRPTAASPQGFGVGHYEGQAAWRENH